MGICRDTESSGKHVPGGRRSQEAEEGWKGSWGGGRGQAVGGEGNTYVSSEWFLQVNVIFNVLFFNICDHGIPNKEEL